MKTYKAYIHQCGEGCGYTIGCAQTVIDIKATSFNEAKQKLSDIINEEYQGERELEKAELFEIEQVFVVDLDSLKKNKEVTDQQIAKQQFEEQERREFERLKSKFGA